MYLNKEQINLLYLVDKGYKTAGNFSVVFSEEYFLTFLRKEFPNTEFIYHPQNAYFIEFYNKELFNKKIKEDYPKLINKSLEEIIKKRGKLFKNSKELFTFYGRLYDYPEICIKEFCENFNIFPKKFLNLGKIGYINIFYKSEKAKQEAKKFIKSLKEIKNKEIPTNGIKLFRSTYYFPKETKFGLLNSPNLLLALKSANIPYVILGHSLYNQKRLSTQVPNIQDILIGSKINFKHNFKFFNITMNKEIFNKYSTKEIELMSILHNKDKIFYDGYFKNQKELEDYILNLIKTSKFCIKTLKKGIEVYKNIL